MISSRMTWITLWCSPLGTKFSVAFMQQGQTHSDSRHSVVDLEFVMKQIADWALNLASQRGASYVDARIVDERGRSLATKNGKVGHAADAESQGIGVRVIADGAWGFAASKDLSRAAVESTAAHA